MSNPITRKQKVHVALFIVLFSILCISYLRSRKYEQNTEVEVFDEILRNPDFHTLPVYHQWKKEKQMILYNRAIYVANLKKI